MQPPRVIRNRCDFEAATTADMNIQRYPLILIGAAVIVGVLVAMVVVISRAPVSDLRGTSPSTLTGPPCEGVPEADRQRCLEAYGIAPAGAKEARGAGG